jgi:hypothetical protein
MRYFIVLSLASFFLIKPCLALDPAAYIGRLTLPFPSECTHQGGGPLVKAASAKGDAPDSCQGPLAFIECKHQPAAAYALVTCKGQNMIWLERFIKYEGQQPVWEITDAMIFPKSVDAQLLDIPACSLKTGKPFAIAAMGYWVMKKKGHFEARPILAAWRLNHVNLKIERIVPRDVVCEYKEGN